MPKEMVHTWEAAGHGKAPFYLAGIISFPGTGLAEANVDAYNNALQAVREQSRALGVTGLLGICNVCGHDLMNNFVVKSRDGKTFVVGSECIRKSGDAGLIEKVKLEERRRRRAKAEEERQAKWESEAPLRETCNQIYAGVKNRKQELESKLSRTIEETNRWFIDILRGVNGDFAKSLSEDLTRKSFEDLSDRCLTICAEIYAKDIAGSRRNKEQYLNAVSDFYRLAKKSGKNVQEKRVEMWDAERELDTEYEEQSRLLREKFNRGETV